MKRILCSILTLAMVFSLCACGGSKSEPAASGSSSTSTATTPAAEPIRIKLTSTNPSSNPEIVAMVEACDRIRERTDGMVDIQVYADGQMLVYAEGIEAVMSNSAVIYFTACNLFSDYVPELTSVYMPYLYPTTEVAEVFFQSDVWNQISDKADAAGLHIISNNIFTGYRHTFANKPVTSAADFEGMALRIPDSTLYIETFNALKTNYMPMAFSEVYSGLQTGMLDGVEATAATAAGYSLYETMDKCYYSLTKHILDNGGYFTGYDFWMSIPEEYRAIIEEELYAAAVEGNQANAEKEQAFIQQLVDGGVEIVEVEDLSSFQDAVSELVSSQPMGQEILDQIKEITG